MNIALWIVQVLLAVAFFAHGVMFLVPPEAVAEQMNAVLPRWFQVSLGMAEIAAAVGITLPGLTRILPSLVVWSSVGIMAVMVCATVWHLVRAMSDPTLSAEYSSAGITAVLLAMATFVAYWRWRVLPIRPRGAVARVAPSA